MENTEVFSQTRRYHSKKRIPATIVMCVCFSAAVLFLVFAIVCSSRLSGLRAERSGLEQRETQSYWGESPNNRDIRMLEHEISRQTSHRRFLVVGAVIWSVAGAFVGGLLFYLARETERRVEAQRKDHANIPQFPYYD